VIKVSKEDLKIKEIQNDHLKKENIRNKVNQTNNKIKIENKKIRKDQSNDKNKKINKNREEDKNKKEVDQEVKKNKVNDKKNRIKFIELLIEENSKKQNRKNNLKK